MQSRPMYRFQTDEPELAAPAEVTYTIGVTASWPQLKDENVSAGAFLRASFYVARLWRPARLVSNLRPGPAIWMAHNGIAQGWDVVGVTTKGQGQENRMYYRESLADALEGCSEHVLCPTPRERDERVSEMVDIVLTIGDILARKVPRHELRELS